MMPVMANIAPAYTVAMRALSGAVMFVGPVLVVLDPQSVLPSWRRSPVADDGADKPAGRAYVERRHLQRHAPEVQFGPGLPADCHESSETRWWSIGTRTPVPHISERKTQR